MDDARRSPRARAAAFGVAAICSGGGQGDAIVIEVAGS
jgi:acetyl-CoA acetyltransferase